ncbi:hypothetical protein ACHAXT_006908 [Thalassiosira profunda]
MLPRLPLLLCLAALLSASHAKEETPFREDEQDQIVFVSPSGGLSSYRHLTVNPTSKTLTADSFAASSFAGDSLEFRGREIRNAHIVDSSVEGLKHLAVDRLTLRSHKNGRGIAVVDTDGSIDTTRLLSWDAEKQLLKLPGLSSHSKDGLEIRSDVDFTSHTLKNANIEANTTLRQLIFQEGVIENSVLRNVTATGLNLGDVKLASLAISGFDSVQAVGSLLIVGEGGTIESASALKQDTSGKLQLGAGLHVVGETYLDGSLTVDGSVLGAGPYVDISDARYKKNIERMDSSDVLERILQLDGVSYELDLSNTEGRGRLGSLSGKEVARDRQLGFVAQDVELLFPELVSTDEADFKGLQYARFAPILAEGMKQLANEVRDLRKEVNDMRRQLE